MELGYSYDIIVDSEVSWSVDKIGGAPIWPHSVLPPEHITPHCGACNDKLYLITQFRAPNPARDAIRLFFVFACNRRICMNKPGSWKVLRCVQTVKIKQPSTEKTAKTLKSTAKNPQTDKNNKQMMTALFSSVSDWNESPSISFGSQNNSKAASFPGVEFKTISEKNIPINLNGVKKESESELKSTPKYSNESAWSCPEFPPRYLEFFLENATDTDEDFKHELKLLSKYEKFTALESDSNEWSGETYEKAKPKFLDKSFKHFQKVVERNPEQCLRYEFAGTPLFFSNDLKQDTIQPCQVCRSPRVFEFQIMPAILSILPTEAYAQKRISKDIKPSKNSVSNLSQFVEQHAQGMEFGTVIVYTCSNDCTRKSADATSIQYFEELVTVQLEEWI